MKNRRLNWQIAVSGILAFAVWFGALPVYSQIKQDGKGVGVKVVSELPSKEKRWALIVGIDEYQNDVSTLKGSVNDAKALKNVLVNNAGFPENQIILMTTDSGDSDLIPTRNNILDQLDKLSRQIPEDGLILFSFSGHGISIGNDAFLIPSDAKIYQNADFMRERAIDVLRVRQAIQATKVKQVLMFLDACRNDPVKGRGDEPNVLTDAYSKGFSFDTKNREIEAYATLYATSFGDRAFEFFDKKANKYRGYFSYAVEEALKGNAANEKGEVTLGSLIKYIETTVKQRVSVEENQRQIPYPTTEGFRNNDLVLAIAGKTSLQEPKTGETSYWQAIENSNNFEDFDNYLARCQSGEFSCIHKATAELKIYQLKKANSLKVWASLRNSAKDLMLYDGINTFNDDGFALVVMGTKVGLVNKLFKVVLPLENYENLDRFTEGLSSFKLGGKEGLVGSDGKIIPPKYDDIDTLTNYSNSTTYPFKKLFKVKLNDKFGLINENGNEVALLKYDEIGSFKEEVAWVKLGNKYGLIDKSGREITPLKYESIEYHPDKLAGVKLNNKYGIIDNTGKEILPLVYDEQIVFIDGLGRLKRNGKYGYADKSGNEVLPVKYDSASFSFSENRSVVSIDGRFIWIDRTGKEISPIRYSSIFPLQEGLARVILNSKVGLIDKTGKEILTPKYDDISEFNQGLAKVKLNNKFGFIGKTGKEIISTRFDEVDDFADGLAAVKLNNKWGFIDKNGREIVLPKYDKVSGFREGVAWVKLNGKYGLVNSQGKQITLIKYSLIKQDFSETKFINNPFSYDSLEDVLSDNKLGFIDKTGKEVIPFKFDPYLDGSFDKHDYTELYVNKRKGIFDRRGQEIIPPKYDDIAYYSNTKDLFWVKISEKFGFVDRQGKEIIPVKYDGVENLSEDLIGLVTDKKVGFADKTGKIIIPVGKYDKIWCLALIDKGFIGVVLNGKKGFVDIYGNEYFDF